jgi:5-methylcytosine-specific restriction enzyme A
VFKRKHPLCADPDKRHVGRPELTSDVDHITPVNGPEDPLFWEQSNHQGLCHSCHNHKTAKENGGLGKVG